MSRRNPETSNNNSNERDTPRRAGLGPTLRVLGVIAGGATVATGAAACAPGEVKVEPSVSQPASPEASENAVPNFDGDLNKAYEYFAVKYTAEELSLKEGATPEQFGEWLMDVTNKWMSASCESADEIVDVEVNQFVKTESDVFYDGIAQQNSNVFVEPLFGKDWQSNDMAKQWYSGVAQLDAKSISLCVQDKPSWVPHYVLVSASDAGIDEKGNQKYLIEQEDKSDNPSEANKGVRESTYTTSIEDGHIVLKAIK